MVSDTPRQFREATFVDTSAWFAAVVPSDPNHPRAVGWLQSNSSALVTTDFIVDELLTLLRFRGESRRAMEFGTDLLQGNLSHVEWVTEADFRNAWEIFRTYHDKAWSFTDCVSRAIIVRLGLRQAFAFDYHFQQFMVVPVVP